MSDWTAEVADRIDDLVEVARDRAVEPIRTAARGVVYGLLAAFFLLTALALTGIALFRLVNVYLPGDVWAAHLVVGGIFVLAGVFSWSKRAPSRRTA